MRIRTMKGVAAVVVSVVLATAACGTTDEAGGDDPTTTGEETTTTGEETTTTEEETTTTEEETTTTTEPDDDEDAARAEAALITAEDFPADFESTPGDDDDSDAEIFEQCAPELDIPGETVAEAESDDFTTGDVDAGDGTQYSADSAVLSSDDIATDLVDLFGDDAFAACATEGIKEAFAPAQATGDLEALADLGVGEQAAGLQGALTLNDPDTGEELVFDIAVAAIRTGDLVTILGGLGANQILDGDLIAELAQTVADRQEG
jgi:hypothetical protein